MTVLTLYTAKICPYAHRVEIALKEANAKDVVQYQIDLKNKPEWYAPKVNPASKVPAVAYGGPDVPPDQPSPDSIKIAESLVLVEFVADLYPDSTLLPKDPVLRAKARFFVDAVGTKLTPAWQGFVSRGDSPDGFFKGVEFIQNLLPKDKKYAVSDEFTVADVAIAPFLGRLDVSLQNDIGGYAQGEGTKVYEALQGSQYARFWKYLNDIKDRSSFKSTFDEEYIRSSYAPRFAALREQNQKATVGTSVV